MSPLDLYSYLAGVASTLAVLVLLLSWLRRMPRFAALPAPSWPMAAAILVALAAPLSLWRVLAPSPATPGSLRAPSATSATGPSATPGTGLGAPAAATPADSMDRAIASLEARLARGGGSADDWELLAKSFEFLGRPADAAKARAQQLPAPPIDATTLTAALGRGVGPARAPAPAPATSAAAAPAPAAPMLTPDTMKLLAQASAARRAKNFQAAATIYARLGAQGQLNADGWADYADTSASLQGNRLAGRPETDIARALALDPRNPKALWLKASAEEESQRWDEAIASWRVLAEQLDPASADARLVAANLQQDLKLAGSAPAAAATTAAAAAAAVVDGEVRIAAALAAKASKGTTLFVIARSADAPGPPLAVLRTTVSAWPLKFRLDDSLAMMPGRTLSSASRITVEARISASGQAMPGSGDLAGSSGVLDPAAREPVRITIDRVQP
jgi:cytochrome c-type biogenesis protein CcmH/NrfG